MLHFGASPYTTCTHNHDMRFPVYNITPPHCVDAVITDTFQSTLFSEVSKLRHLLAEQITLHPPCIDPNDLRKMQSETMTEYMMLGPSSHRAGFEFGILHPWESGLPSTHNHEITGYPIVIRRLDHHETRRISRRKTHEISPPIMSSYSFLPPVVKSTFDALGIWDGDIKEETTL
jgi:hypothetical protein